jgi:hypothetical protein
MQSKSTEFYKFSGVKIAPILWELFCSITYLTRKILQGRINKVENSIEMFDVANLCHEQWAGWMEYLFKKSQENDDGSVTIPKDLVRRWKRQMYTDYKDLPIKEQESDNVEARKFLNILSPTFKCAPIQPKTWVDQIINSSLIQTIKDVLTAAEVSCDTNSAIESSRTVTFSFRKPSEYGPGKIFEFNVFICSDGESQGWITYPKNVTELPINAVDPSELLHGVLNLVLEHKEEILANYEVFNKQE